MNEILTWEDLNKFKIEDLDRVNGINNSFANLRLFDHKEDDVLVTKDGNKNLTETVPTDPAEIESLMQES